MPKTTKEEQDRKLKSAVASIKGHGFKSTNRFVETFYKSDTHSAQSLRYQPGAEFLPEKLLNIWDEKVPSGEARQAFNLAVTKKAAEIMVKESTTAYKDPNLRLPVEELTIPYLTTDFGLNTVRSFYANVLPCLSLLLMTLLTAPNDYEAKKKKEKKDKDIRAQRIVVVLISMMIFFRNRASNAFPLVVGIFLASSGASRRIIDVFNHMGLSVGYDSIQRGLESLTNDAQKRARDFVRSSERLWGVVYDNINFTLRPSSVRLDSATTQINATTLAVFSFPLKFTKAAYKSALDVLARNKRRWLRNNLELESLIPTEEKQEELRKAFAHGVRSIILAHIPGRLRKRRNARALRKHTKSLKPKGRCIGHDKTEFYPLPALDEEEASVAGTIRVVETIFCGLLNLAIDLINVELRFMVGDWLTIRNLRLMRDERRFETLPYHRFDWVQENPMPFHFQLNAMYCLFRTHLGTAARALINPSFLLNHNSILRRPKLDPKKPEYNKAKELVMHSLIARLLDTLRYVLPLLIPECLTHISGTETTDRLVLEFNSFEDLKTWAPTATEFEDAVQKIVTQFATTEAASEAMKAGDDVMAHSILFIRDALLFWEFCQAIREANVGRMWLVYDFWVFMFRGAGCHNYGNEILEMKAQYEHEFTPLLRELAERTWLVNRWGKKGRSIPTDLYLEHNNGFIKNLFAALGSSASIRYIQTKSSACVEVLRTLAHQMSEWFGGKDTNRQHLEVSVAADIEALCTDIAMHQLHKLTPNRRVQDPQSQTTSRKTPRAVVDVLDEGMKMLFVRGMFDQWKNRTAPGSHVESDTLVGTVEVDENGVVECEGAFEDPDGQIEVDTGLDREFSSECAFSNFDNTTTED
ncbi:hypothetical protein NMY22_g15085 [Coprinellus aureogranulatus]|nr:hypothetical protein NMY22_g15085 [Coprinellus aureogranulatus]